MTDAEWLARKSKVDLGAMRARNTRVKCDASRNPDRQRRRRALLHDEVADTVEQGGAAACRPLRRRSQFVSDQGQQRPHVVGNDRQGSGESTANCGDKRDTNEVSARPHPASAGILRPVSTAGEGIH
jgi:hypothetical protein